MGCKKKKTTRDECFVTIVKTNEKLRRSMINRMCHEGVSFIYATYGVAKGGLEGGRREMCIKQVLHHLLVCRTAVSVVFALKSGK